MLLLREDARLKALRVFPNLSKFRTPSMTTLLRRRILALALFLSSGLTLLPANASAQSTEKFYYWVGPGLTRYPPPDQSFVIEVNASQAAQIEAILSDKGWPGFGGTIAAGSVDYNRDYNAPGQPVWNWHVASVNGIFDFRATLFPACECPYLIAKPSDIAANPDAWIQQNGDHYTPIRYSIQRRVDPSNRDAMANVSNRGVTGTGERRLITGFIVTGGTPRNIVVRALGPSLSAVGIQQPASNPKLEVYQGSTRIASNADWKNDSRAQFFAQDFPSLVPSNEKEAALWLTLLPGSYTIQAINEDGSDGIVVVEAYDVDSAAP